MRTPGLLPMVSVLMVALFSQVFADEQTDRAVAAAKEWLGFVDAGDYAKSWREAAPVFQKSISEEKWIKMVASVRGPLGAVRSRELIGAQNATSLPGESPTPKRHSPGCASALPAESPARGPRTTAGLRAARTAPLRPTPSPQR